MTQCGRCHEKEAVTFFDTMHGKVSRLGDAAAAKCYDCHGTHNILPPIDLASTLSRGHVVETCGKCHEGAHRRFAGYLTHATHHDPDKYPALYYTYWGMTSLLVGVFSFFGIHTLLWLPRAFTQYKERREHAKTMRTSGGTSRLCPNRRRVRHLRLRPLRPFRHSPPRGLPGIPRASP